MNWALAKGYIEGERSTITYNGMELLHMGPGCQIYFSASRARYMLETIDGYSMANHPVTDVTWYGAVAYCNWLSESQGEQVCYDLSAWTLSNPDAGGYRLPTEAEWERAAAWDADAGRHWRYGNAGDTLDTSQANFDEANPLDLPFTPYTTPVGYYQNQTSPAGCYDMSGNVSEWVNDWYAGGDYYAACAVGVTDPLGPASGHDRVMRGGCWDYGSYHCRSSLRDWTTPDQLYKKEGFRIAR